MSKYVKIEDVSKILDSYALGISFLRQALNAIPAVDEVPIKNDADVMFNALFSIISDGSIDDLDKCMTVASNAINSILDKTRNDTPHSL